MRRTLLALAMALFATSAMAVDLFTLSVPVQLSHIHPSVTEVRVMCRLSGRSWLTSTPMEFAHYKDARFPITGGTFNRTIAIIFATEDFSTEQQAHLSNVTGGTCEFQLHTSDGAWIEPYATGAIGPVNSHAPGTPFANVVSFVIP